LNVHAINTLHFCSAKSEAFIPTKGRTDICLSVTPNEIMAYFGVRTCMYKSGELYGDRITEFGLSFRLYLCQLNVVNKSMQWSRKWIF